MKNCATCRFMAEERIKYDLTDGERLGYRSCVRIIHGNNESATALSNSPAMVVDGSGYAARLKVLPTFGCVLHEEKR